MVVEQLGKYAQGEIKRKKRKRKEKILKTDNSCKIIRFSVISEYLS
jgi:hypothetical protein